MFPWMEYLVRVGWTPNDDLLVQLNTIEVYIVK